VEVHCKHISALDLDAPISAIRTSSHSVGQQKGFKNNQTGRAARYLRRPDQPLFTHG